jgi:uncharacterized damage-inducible protein DinB
MKDTIDAYAGQADGLGKWIDGLTEDELSAHPVEGRWSVRELVVHMYDSELVGADRMKRVIAMQGDAHDDAPPDAPPHSCMDATGVDARGDRAGGAETAPGM